MGNVFGGNQNEVNDSPVVIRFLDFNIFKELSEFPRNPEYNHLTTSLESIDRNESLLIFISHCWLRPTKECEGWCGIAHPDNKANDKFQLSVIGIKNIWKTLAPEMKRCYVWLDFSCIDQDHRADLPKQLKRYDKIIECCDAIFTPIVDHDVDWNLDSIFYDIIEEYKAKLWRDGPNAYLNRAWCRVEMLYAAHIPLLGNTNDVERCTLFEAGLAYHCKMNRRPHFLYGHYDHRLNLGVRLLPPLQNSFLQRYSPENNNSFLTVAADRQKIRALMKKLQPYIDANKVKVGYAGDLSPSGLRHGYGRCQNLDGSVYEGQWVNNERHGTGTYHYIEGNVFVGNWIKGKRTGQGTMRFCNGDVFSGCYEDDRSIGVGSLRFGVSGRVYEGTFKDRKRNGFGIERWPDGYVYIGDWVLGKQHGFGTSYYNNGEVYEGYFKNATRDGHGIFLYNNGDVYEGDWKNREKNGHGTLRMSNGDVYEGDFEGDVKHGVGTLRYVNGVEYREKWKNGVLEESLVEKSP